MCLFGFFSAGCASVSLYTKPEASWATIQKVGVFQFQTPFEDRIRRQWATQLFVRELQRTRRFEVVELDLPPPSPGAPDFSASAKKAGVDAYLQGTIEDLAEIFADLQMVDAATGETLWSIRYHRGGGPEFSFCFTTSQQQLQRIFRLSIHNLIRTTRS